MSTTGLDLTSSAGAQELAKRVSDAARAACKEIGRNHPTARPDDETCAKAATDEAMVKVNRLVAAAQESAKR